MLTEEMFLNLDLLGIKSIILGTTYRPRDPIQTYINNLTLPENGRLLIRQPDECVHLANLNNKTIYLLLIDKIESFSPLKIKNVDLDDSNYSIILSNYSTPTNYNKEIKILYQNCIILSNLFSQIKEVSGDHLFNW